MAAQRIIQFVLDRAIIVLVSRDIDDRRMIGENIKFMGL
jgi:hypothetical protein